MEHRVIQRDQLDHLVDRVVESYLADPRTSHLDAAFLPSRTKTVELIELLRRLVFPGFFDEHRLSPRHHPLPHRRPAAPSQRPAL